MIWQLFFFAGAILLFIRFMNDMPFRNPQKRGLVNIKDISAIELNKLPDITIFKQNYSRSTYGRSTNHLTKRLSVHSVVLLSENHRKRVKVFSSYSKNAAKQELVRISEEYNKPIVRYSPIISEKTKNSRR